MGQPKQEAGVSGLRAQRRGRPVGGRLKPKQERTIRRLITDHCPDQVKLPFYLWTREAVVHLIAQRCGVRLSVWTAGRLLARWGFTPQKPTRRAFEQDSQEVRSWLRRQYPAIRALARREKALSFWADEMGLRGDRAAGRSFSPQGQTQVISGTGQRFRCNLISALTNRGQLQFMVFKERFTVAVFLNSWPTLAAEPAQNLPDHRQPSGASGPGHAPLVQGPPSTTVRRFPARLQSQADPDEYLNQDVKTNAVGPTRPLDRKEMIGNVRLPPFDPNPPLAGQTYFQAGHVRYASV